MVASHDTETTIINCRPFSLSSYFDSLFALSPVLPYETCLSAFEIDLEQRFDAFPSNHLSTESTPSHVNLEKPLLTWTEAPPLPS